MTKSAIPGAKRTNLFLVDPNQLTLVWDDADPRFENVEEHLWVADIDSLEGEKHSLFDDRVFLPLAESHVKAAMKNGILQNVIVRKNGELFEVVDGRRRTLNAREANKRLGEAGEPLIRLRVTIQRGDEKGAMTTMITANELRTPDEVFNKAKKANRLMERGADKEEIAEAFDVTVTTINNWLKLLEMDDKVQKACRSGQVNISEAIKWSKDDHEQQKKNLTAHVEATKKRAADPYKGKPNKNGAAPKPTRAKAPGKAKIRALIEAMPTSKTKDALMWAVGDLSTRKAKETVKELKEI
jgi:ParB family chromosome partitioning protein